MKCVNKPDSIVPITLGSPHSPGGEDWNQVIILLYWMIGFWIERLCDLMIG